MSATDTLTPEQKKRLLAAVLAKKRGNTQHKPSTSAIETIMPDPAAELEPFPMTEVQQAYWLGRNHQFALGGVASHSYQEFQWRENLGLEAYRRAWHIVIQRHAMMRTIVDEDGRFQTLGEVPELVITFQDLSSCSDHEQHLALEKWREELSHQCLPAHCWPLFEIRVSKLNDASHLIHFSADALLWDVYSDFIIFRELKHFYLEPRTPLPAPALSFRDYMVSWLHGDGVRQARKKAEAYWLTQLDHLPMGPALPLLKPVEAMGQPRFSRLGFALGQDESQRLNERAASIGVTPSMVLLTAFADVLRLWSQNLDFTLNLTLFNRPPIHADIASVVGDFTSTLLLPCHAPEAKDFATRASQTQQNFLAAFEHREFSGVDVLRAWTKKHGQGANALMPVVFTSALSAGDFSDKLSAQNGFGEEVYGISQTPQVLIDHQVYEQNGKLITNWDCVLSALAPGMFAAMLDCYQAYLKRLLAPTSDWRQEHSTEEQSPALVERERKVLADANATHKNLTLAPIHRGFFEQAQASPDALALVSAEQRLSYAQLAGYSQTLRNHLQLHNIAHTGVANTKVALWLPRGWQQVAAVLAVLANRAAFVPLSAAWPTVRVLDIIALIDASAIVTTAELAQALPAELRDKCVFVDDLHMSPVDFSLPAAALEDTAYIIFTSGSTGKPKGVVIDHRGAANTLVDIQQRFDISRDDAVLSVSSLVFDLSIFDIFGMLAVGGKVVMLEQQHERNPENWSQLVQREQITIWNSVPAIFQMLHQFADGGGDGDLAHLPSLRLVMLSGDWLPVKLCEQLRTVRPDIQLVSLGGATEASIWSVCYPIDVVNPTWNSIPYGKPLANQQMYVLDKALRQRPIGVTGDLYIAGDGLALEYWANPEQNARHFIRHPISGERLYFTGDLARYLADGNLEFWGRSDFQVKINGFRVELGEIEHAIVDSGLVEQVVVTIHQENNKRSLIAYLVNAQLTSAARPEQLKKEQLEKIKALLEEKLPSYMLPGYYIWLEQLPMSANGKIDRKLLPAPNVADDATEGNDTPPETADEQRISGLLAEILDVPKVSCVRNFLEVGANSLDLVKLHRSLEQSFPGRYKLLDLFEHSSVQKLARFHRQTSHRQQEPHVVSTPLDQARARVKRRRRVTTCES